MSAGLRKPGCISGLQRAQLGDCIAPTLRAAAAVDGSWSQVANVFPRRRDHDTAANLRFGRTQAFTTWADVTCVAMAA
jgi:hypothetical protein